jgi:tripartite-type tricarboxylate transporter receptor subunit TctC
MSVLGTKRTSNRAVAGPVGQHQAGMIKRTLPDLLGGQVQVTINPTPSSIDFIRAGKLRALAVTTAMRQEVLPDIPTVGEFVPGYEATVWFGIGAPKNTPAGFIEKLNREINAGLADPKIKKRLTDLGHPLSS